MTRLPPISTRTDTLFPYTTLFLSIAALLTMPDLDGLFRRIIMQSASIGRLFFDPEEAEKLGRSFLKHLDLDYGDAHKLGHLPVGQRSEEHTSELQSLMRISYAVFCLKKQK